MGMEDKSSHHSIDKLSEKKFSTPFKNEENTRTQNNESEHVLVSSDNILNCSSSTDSSSSSDKALYNKKISSNKDARHRTKTKKGESLAKSDIDYSSARKFYARSDACCRN